MIAKAVTVTVGKPSVAHSVTLDEAQAVLAVSATLAAAAGISVESGTLELLAHATVDAAISLGAGGTVLAEAGLSLCLDLSTVAAASASSGGTIGIAQGASLTVTTGRLVTDARSLLAGETITVTGGVWDAAVSHWRRRGRPPLGGHPGCRADRGPRRRHATGTGDRIGAAGEAVTNDGTILADSSGGTLTVAGSVGNGDVLAAAGTLSGDGGAISVGGGTLDLAISVPSPSRPAARSPSAGVCSAATARLQAERSFWPAERLRQPALRSRASRRRSTSRVAAPCSTSTGCSYALDAAFFGSAATDQVILPFDIGALSYDGSNGYLQVSNARAHTAGAEFYVGTGYNGALFGGVNTSTLTYGGATPTSVLTRH